MFTDFLVYINYTLYYFIIPVKKIKNNGKLILKI